MSVRHFGEQVAAARPVPFSEHAVVFELRDGRVSKQSNLIKRSRRSCIASRDRGWLPFDYLTVVLWFYVVQLAELRRAAEGCGEWEWTRIIGTPTSACMTSYWTAVAT